MYNSRLSKADRNKIKQVRKLAPVLGYSNANKVAKSIQQNREEFDYSNAGSFLGVSNENSRKTGF